MDEITWLHLSDWHQKGRDFNRKVVRDALIKDIEQRSKIDSALENIDFIVFSGDVAYSGKHEEYQIAIDEFFTPILNATGLSTDKLIVVPGNHDFEWSAIDLLPSDLLDKFDSPEKVTEWLIDERKRHVLLQPMAHYSEFIKAYLGEVYGSEPAFGYERLLEIRDKKIGIVGINSAWLSGQNKETKKGKVTINDYGHLILGEAQIYDLLESEHFSNADVRIAVMHHPFDWLVEFDRQIVRDKLRKASDFILHGHEHQPELRIESGTSGNCITIPAGPSYDRREPEVSRCANAYNYVYLNFQTGKGIIYLRRYEDRQGWIKDTSTTGDPNPGLWNFNLPKNIKKTPKKQFSTTKESLSSHLEKTLQLYLATCYERDQYAKLDQAGETDPDRTTLLRKVFVDLEVGQYREAQPKDIHIPSTLKSQQKSLYRVRDNKRFYSVLQCFLQEIYPKSVIIGGPGHGKSTLSQFLCQIHRAHLLYRMNGKNKQNARTVIADETSFIPTLARIPFRIILKYFAQWLSENPNGNVEMYLVEQLERDSSEKITLSNVHEIFREKPILVIFDGLDEVIEIELRENLLNRIAEFLRRIEQLNSNVQILATSRPTGYTGQFNPEEFWHLELQPMSDEKVREYSEKWTNVKVQSEEEKSRILETLKECQQEEHTKLLLTTPLQVTIVLLITKDGGKPPAQREALFNEYWNTIYRREKAKSKGMIRTEEALLFELHSYLGYLLHFRAAKENVRSLFPKEEFINAVKTFLKAKDSHSPDEEIQIQTNLMVKEAGERLVLLVEPEQDFFGFEMRSLQEFFAAAYLAQTARDTHQRFERLKSIAPHAHWRNVVLFFAGRIVRNFSGEAANILELVCRSIDRDASLRYTRPGAWLALDVATDGAFASNRDLQYGALEYALSLLDTGLSNEGHQNLTSALQQLSSEDKRDILMPIIEQKLLSLPVSCLPTALDISGNNFGSTDVFLQGITSLLSTKKTNHILQALRLCLLYKTEKIWLAKRLNDYWETWIEDKDICRFINENYMTAPDYYFDLISTWSLSKDQAHQLIKILLNTGSYYHRLPKKKITFIEMPQSVSDQIILVLQCQYLISNQFMLAIDSATSLTKGDTPFTVLPNTKAIMKWLEYYKNLSIPVTYWEKLLRLKNLFPETRTTIWTLYLLVTDSLEGIKDWIFEANIGEIDHKYVNNNLRYLLPKRATIVEKYSINNKLMIDKLEECSIRDDIDMGEFVKNQLEDLLKNTSQGDLSKLMFDLTIGKSVNFLDISSTANNFRINSKELLNYYLLYKPVFKKEIQDEELLLALLEIEKIIKDKEKTKDVLDIIWYISKPTWKLNKETFSRGVALLDIISSVYGGNPEVMEAWIVLFFKLLTYYDGMIPLIPKLFSSLKHEYQQSSKSKFYMFSDKIPILSKKQLERLAKFISSEDIDVQQGSVIIWDLIIQATVFRDTAYILQSYGKRKHEILSLNLDWKIPWSIINNSKGSEKYRGISLLTISNFPLKNENYRKDLLNLISITETVDEIEAWIQYIKHSPGIRKNWREFLEPILSQLNLFPPEIIGATVERYIEAVGEKSFDIDHDYLGLPNLKT